MFNITDEMLAEAIFEVDMTLAEMFPDSEELGFEPSNTFREKMARLVRRAKFYPVRKGLQRAACILIAFVLSASLCVMAHPTARAAVVEWVKEHFEDVYYYFFQGEETDSTGSADAGTMEYCLGWVPDGYTLSNSFDSANVKTYVYTNKAGDMLQFSYQRGSDTNFGAFGDGEFEHIDVLLDDFSADVYLAKTSRASNGIVWTDSTCDILCYISGFIGKDELIKMAKNLVVKTN